MPALPAASDFTGATVTEGNFKTAITAQRDYLAGLMATDGTKATALATLGVLASVYSAKTAAYTVVAADRGRCFDATSGTWTLTLPAVASMSGFSFILRNSGAGTITIDPSGAELIDGVATVAVTAGGAVLVICTGTDWKTAWMLSPTGAILAAKAPLASPAFTGTPTFAGQTLFADGTAGLPGKAYTLDTDTGEWRPGTNTLAWSTAGLEAFRVGGSQNIFIGTALPMTGIGTSRVTSQGASAATGQWAIGQFTNTNGGATIALSKSRATTVDTYTIVTAADNLANIEAWGADGITMVLAAKLQAYNIGTPAAGDVRGGWRIQTGSGPGATTTRLAIDDTTIAATLPITTTGTITDGFNALTAGTLALAFATKGVATVTPNLTGTFTTTVPAAGTRCTLIITTSGTTSYTMTFGTGFVSAGTLATGVVTAKKFAVSFVSDGTSLIETARTAAM